MTDVVPHLAPRSVVAIADLELLRVARTDIDVREIATPAGVRGRIRGLVSRPALGPASRLRAAGRVRLSGWGKIPAGEYQRAGR